jgi:hypothetical protein
MAIRTSSEIITNIQTDLADNNSGAISAADVRNNMVDSVESINAIVASGDTENTYPFFRNVKIKKTGSDYGRLIVESGILFPNAPNNAASLQVEPWLGVNNINHNQLTNLTGGDPHTQYLNVNGNRAMTGNLRLDTNWVGASGVNGEGFKFERTANSGVRILTSGSLVFDDGSAIKSGKGLAKAWISFDASGVASVPVVKTSYNIASITSLGAGKFRLNVSSGVLNNGPYVAIGTSNATSTSGSLEDFGVNTVGLVARSGVDPNISFTFAVKNLANQFVDAEINEVVIFGNG